MATQIATNGKRFDWATHDMKRIEEVAPKIGAMDAEGWELVSCAEGRERFVLVFRRAKS